MIQSREKQRHMLCREDELTSGEIRTFAAGRRRVALARLRDGSFRAIADNCPHEGASLGSGAVESMWTSDVPGCLRASGERNVAVCPWHNFEFDLDSGLTPNVTPRLRVKTYDTRLEDGEVVVYA